MFLDYKDAYYIKKSLYKSNHFKRYERAILRAAKKFVDNVCMLLVYKLNILSNYLFAWQQQENTKIERSFTNK